MVTNRARPCGRGREQTAGAAAAPCRQSGSPRRAAMVSFGGIGGLPSTQPQPVTLTGLVSGLNTASIIQQLQAANKAELQPIQSQISQQNTIQQAYTNLNTSLNALLTTAQNFQNVNFLQGATANVTPGGASPTVSATATAGAA